MRAAPAVRVTVHAGALARGVPALLAALAASALAAWAAGQFGVAAAWGLVAAPPAAALAWQATGGPPAELAWDGAQWWLDGVAGRAELRIDLQQALLLRWTPQPAGRVRWLVPTEAGCGDRWHALRVALRGRLPRAAEPPAAA